MNAQSPLGVHSETRRLRTVMVCPPGLAHRRLTPSNRRSFFSTMYFGSRMRKRIMTLSGRSWNARLAPLESPNMLAMFFGMPLSVMLASMYPRSNIYRALVVNPGSGVALDPARIYARNLEVPSGGGVGTARGIAKAYGIFAADGHELGLRPETQAALAAPPVPPNRGFYDECMKGEAKFSLDFMKPSAAWPFGGLAAFGALGFAPRRPVETVLLA